MNMMEWLLVIRVNYKKTVILITIKKAFFCQAYCFNFFSNQDSFFVHYIKFKKLKSLLKNITEELMTMA